MIILQSGIRRGIIARAPAGAGGALVDGDNAVVTIPGAGSNIAAANQEFLGASWGPVESASPGAVFDTFMPAGWGMPGDTGTSVSTVRALNGTKSLLNDRSLGFQFAIRYDTGAEQGAARVTWSFYMHNPTDITMQLKQVRIVGAILGGGGYSDVDQANVYFRSLTSNSAGSSEGIAVNNAAGSVVISSVGTGFEEGYTGDWYGQGFWVTNEATIIRNSASGVADGRIVIVSRNAETGAVIGRRVVPAYNFTSTDAFLRYIVWQGYMGNFPGGEDPTGIRLYLDRDFYMCWNSSRVVPKVIKIGNASTYAACTAFIDQRFTAWNVSGSDAEIEFRFNQGRLPDGYAWAYALSDADTPINTTGVVPTKV